MNHDISYIAVESIRLQSMVRRRHDFNFLTSYTVAAWWLVASLPRLKITSAGTSAWPKDPDTNLANLSLQHRSNAIPQRSAGVKRRAYRPLYLQRRSHAGDRYYIIIDLVEYMQASSLGDGSEPIVAKRSILRNPDQAEEGLRPSKSRRADIEWPQAKLPVRSPVPR